MSSIRITGLATGIDTDKLIKDIMNVERTRVDKVQQDRQILQWRQELYNSINKDFANFILNTRKSFGLTGTTSTGAMYNNTLNNLNWIKSATSSNENVVKASTTAQAIDGNYNLTVHRLADGVKAASGENIKAGIEGVLSGLPEGGTIEFKINDGSTITIEKTDTMSSIVKKINSSGAGVQASFDDNIGRLFIQTTATGKDAKLSFTDVNGSTGFIEALKLNVTAYDESTGEIETPKALAINEIYKGTNAKIDFAGATGIEKQSNQFTINGINLDLRVTGTTTIRVATDTDAVYDKIKDFVDKYNELVDKMGKLLGEKQYRDYRPLSAEQKKL